MHGWSLLTNLVNFAILAGGLFIIGKKIVLRMIAQHREEISRGLEAAQQAQENAQNMASQLQEIEAQGKSDSERIIDEGKHRLNLQNEQNRQSLEAYVRQLQEEKAGTPEDGCSDTLKADTAARIAACLEKETAEQLKNSASGRNGKAMTEKFLARLPQMIVPSYNDRSRMEQRLPVKARVLTAEPAEESVMESVRSILRKAFPDCEICLENRIEPSVLGGMKLVIGDTVYDGSLGHMLKQAGQSLRQSIARHPEEDIRQGISRVSTEIQSYQTGHVVRLFDGICRVNGLSDAMAGEMLRFPGDLIGMVMDLDSSDIGVVLLGDYSTLHEGDEVLRTGRIIEVPVGDAMVGRVVDALGRPIDGKGIIVTDQTRPIEVKAPPVIARKPVSVPMQTGIKAIDALVPIGRGQRELIIGDRQTGKTAIAIDTILNQKGKNLTCIYVAIGQKESTVEGVVEKLRDQGAMDYTIVVCASASEPAPMLYIAPYAGAAMGEYFMYSGRDVLIIYDDLSKQAVAYREISLLLHRPPGREAYPGDIFYLHSRLLERAARLNEENGGGSMTALPIIETQAGDISAYIPTNVISITDGQIFLETDLFNSGVRPAVNVGLSVSRVGGSAQPGAMKQVAGRLRMDLAQYRELAAFSQFGSDLDKSTRDTLARGDRMTELLKQPQYSPMSASDMVIAITAVNNGYADGVELKDIHDYEQKLINYVNHKLPDFRTWVASGAKLSQTQQSDLKQAIADFTAEAVK